MYDVAVLRIVTGFSRALERVCPTMSRHCWWPLAVCSRKCA